jgi:chromosome segregation ATPase
MSFLGRNINLALVSLIVIMLLLAAGVTILYQRGLQERTSQLENTSSNLSSCLTALANYKDVLSQSQEKLNATSQDIRKYDTLYSQKVAELTQTQQQLTTTQGQLNDMTLQKEQFKNLYGQAALNITVLQSSINSLNSQIYSYRNSLSACQSSLSSCQAGH